MMKGVITSLLLIAFCSNVQGQQKQVRTGNKLYEEKKYKEAATVYQNALKKNPNYLPGIFNLGNALYQQKNYDGSRKTYDALSKKANDPRVKASTDYNIGNTYMSEQKWEEAVNAYKQALRKNPQDEDAKYNLSYAQQMMKKNQGGGGKDKNKDKNKDNKQDQENKDDQNKDQREQNKDQQQQNQDNQQDKKEEQKEQQKPQPQPSKLSEKQAEQLLNALAQEEKKLHDKKEKGKAVKVKVEKDW